MQATNRIIVSRHPAAVEFVRAKRPEFANAPVVATATLNDVRGKIVAGNLPMHLAVHALAVVAVEFAGTPPRGAEYTLDDMIAAGARLSTYHVGFGARFSPWELVFRCGPVVSHQVESGDPDEMHGYRSALVAQMEVRESRVLLCDDIWERVEASGGFAAISRPCWDDLLTEFVPGFCPPVAVDEGEEWELWAIARGEGKPCHDWAKPLASSANPSAVFRHGASYYDCWPGDFQGLVRP